MVDPLIAWDYGRGWVQPSLFPDRCKRRDVTVSGKSCRRDPHDGHDCWADLADGLKPVDVRP